MPDENTGAAGSETEQQQQTGQQTGQQQSQSDGDQGDANVPPEVARALKKANKEAETLRLKLKEFEDRDKTELQRANERAEKAEREFADAQVAALRFEVAAEKGLTVKQARRLVGSTRQELEADADELLADFGSRTTTRRAPDFDAGARQKSTSGAPDMNAAIRRAAGRS